MATNIWRRIPSGRITSLSVKTNPVADDFWEYAGGGSALTKDIADSLTITDNCLAERIIIKEIADSLSLSDNITIKEIGQALSEIITLSDSLEKYTERVIIDAITLSDENVKEAQIKRDETISLIDNLINDLSVVFLDEITFYDNLSAIRGIGLSLADEINISDIMPYFVLTIQGGGGGSKMKRWTGTEWKDVNIIVVFQ